MTLLALVLAPLSAHAVTPGEMLPDPAMEARARAITSELRCLVCQNQSVDDSDAPSPGICACSCATKSAKG